MKIKSTATILASAAIAVLGFSQLASAATVTAKNDLDIARPSETVVVQWSDLHDQIPADKVQVSEGGKEIVSQVVDLNDDGKPDELVFQSDFAPNESKTFEVKPGTESNGKAQPHVFGRYVPEREDDFGWENDRIAFRMYGPALEKSDPAGSGIDVWAKRTHELIINKWYKGGEGSYHKDHGEGLDGYKVAHGRGCGGTGVWRNGKLYTTGNAGYKSWKVFANGPVRLVFELTYAPIDAGGMKVSEVKRITLDAHTNLNMIQSTFTSPDTAYTGQGQPIPIEVAAGIGKHDDRPGQASIEHAKDQGWIRYWDALDKPDKTDNGNIGCGVIMKPSQVVDAVDQPEQVLLITKAEPGKPVTYWAGAGWDKSGDFSSLSDWDKYLEQAAKRIDSPLKVSVSE